MKDFRGMIILKILRRRPKIVNFQQTTKAPTISAVENEWKKIEASKTTKKSGKRINSQFIYNILV